MESTDCPDKGYVFDNVMEKSETNYPSLGQFWSVIHVSEVHVVYNYLKLDQSIDLNIFPEVQGTAQYDLSYKIDHTKLFPAPRKTIRVY